MEGASHSNEIRPSVVADAAEIAERIKTENTVEEIAEELAMYDGNRGTVPWEHLVAVLDGEIVGIVAMIPTRYFPPERSHRAELADIVVAPAHQGHGVARALVAAARERAREMGVLQLETAAWSWNEVAVHAYRRMGFEEWGRLPDALREDDGRTTDLVCLTMRV